MRYWLGLLLAVGTVAVPPVAPANVAVYCAQLVVSAKLTWGWL